jgi:cardiolipin synthase A/B
VPFRCGMHLVVYIPLMTLWEFYLNSEQTWAAMLNDLEKAEKTIDLEQFIFQDDEVGRRFAEVLMKKAGQGLVVRLLCDTAGSLSFFTSELVSKLKEAGVEVKFFNEISPWRITRLKIWFFRDHRKILVVDGRIAFIGGVGIGEKLLKWRDTHVRLVGPIVSEIQEAFGRMWRIVGREKFFPFKKPRASEDGFMLATSAPHFRQRYIHHEFMEAVRAATSCVYITTPYFVPDRAFVRVLRLAARRKVDVRLLVPEASDHPFVDAAGRGLFKQLLKSGVRIYFYKDDMLHSKTMVVDEDWATVGSSNIDNYSFFFNYEANVISTNKAFVLEIKNHFLNDLENTKEVTREEWKRRPWIAKAREVFWSYFASFF